MNAAAAAAAASSMREVRGRFGLRVVALSRSPPPDFFGLTSAMAVEASRSTRRSFYPQK